jgi:hypothetical protein
MRFLARLSALLVAAALGLAAVGGDASGDPAKPAASGAHARPKKRVKPVRVKKVPATRTTSRLTLAAQASSTHEPLVVESALPPVSSGHCPSDMVSIDQRYCVDRYEASLFELTSAGEVPFPPYGPVDGHVVRAMSIPGVFPQGYISGVQAADACGRSGKRLCKAMEWRKACAGPDVHTYGYADTRERGRCNDAGRSPMVEIFHLGGDSSPGDWDPLRMNDPRLNQLPGSLARTGSHPSCTNDYGVFDMVGNLHEWIDDPNGTFQGGYYLDTTINGEGCGYRTIAHDAAYHDYSTGFRCCADPG